MEEVKTQRKNLAVAFYDYKKTYDKVHHDWMLRVYSWMGLPANVISLLRHLISYWKTQLKIWNEEEDKVSRWIDIMCGFLQCDSYSQVGFCLSEVPVCKLIQETKGYQMGEPGKRKVKRTHSLFIDNLKVYQESYKNLKGVNVAYVNLKRDVSGRGLKSYEMSLLKQTKLLVACYMVKSNNK